MAARALSTPSRVAREGQPARPSGSPAPSLAAQPQSDGVVSRADRRSNTNSKGRRSCVGCNAGASLDDVRTADARLADVDVASAPIVRLLIGPNNEIVVDSGDGTFGRGAHVHASPACLQRAVKAGLPKVVRGAPMMSGAPLSASVLAGAIAEAYDRRLEGLLSAAKRARKVQVGSDAACASLRAGEASLVLVAVDAAAAAERTEVRAAIREGAGIAWGTKARLGALLRPALEDSAPEVGVVAITDTRIAAAIRETRTVIDSVAQTPRGPQRHGEFRQDSPAIRHASILNEGTATLSPPALPGSGTEEPPLGSAE